MTNKNEPIADHDMEFIPDEEGELPDLQKKIKKLKDDLKTCDVERKEYLDGWQRAKADYINYKKDDGKRFEDIIRFSAAAMIEDILPVLDSFELALRDEKEKNNQGFLLIRSQLFDVLKKKGLEIIEARAGDPFNPQKHESIGEMEIENEYPAGTVAQVVQMGYSLAGRIIRPARVKLIKSH